MSNFKIILSLKNISLKSNSTNISLAFVHKTNYTLDNKVPLKKIENSIPKIVNQLNNSISNYSVVANNEKKSESVRKILENIENGKSYIEKLNHKDKTKLFLNNFQSNVLKIDHLINKF